MLAGQFSWDRQDAPNNFSAFFLPKLSPLSTTLASVSTSGTSGLELHVKVTEGGGLSDADIKKALEQRITWPTTVDALSHQIQNYAHTLAMPTNPKAMVILNLLSWVAHVNKNQTKCEEQQLEDDLYLGKILLQIDRCVQQWLFQCSTAKVCSDVDDTLIDFTSLQREIVMSRFDIKPPAFLIKKDKRGKKRQSESDEPAERATPAPNLEQVPEWKLRRGENYKTVFHDNINMIPKIGDQFICGRFHVKGCCFSDCKHYHKKVRGPKIQEMTGWVTSCRAAAEPDE